MVKPEEVEYYAKRKEADTRMTNHIRQLPSGTNVAVRTVNTDVVAIALGCFHLSQDKRIWVDSGVQSKNNLTYISINQLFDTLGEPLCKAIAILPCLYWVWLHFFVQQKREDKAVQAFWKKFWTSRNISESVALWRNIWWHQINHRVLCVSNVWKKEDKLSQSSTYRDLCYKVLIEKRICFSQANSSKEVGFKHNAAVFQSLTSKDQVMYLCCKYLDELT